MRTDGRCAMKIIAVDDEPWALEDALRCVRKAAPDVDVRGFLRPEEALAWVRDHPVDVLLLDIEMPGMDGIALAKAASEACPGVRIIFLTSFDQHALKAFSVHATAYLLKPIEVEELARELAFVRGGSRAASRSLTSVPPCAWSPSGGLRPTWETCR